MRHNKKRNTAFIYEILSRELTKAIVAIDSDKKATIVALIKEHFSGSSLLNQELHLYKNLLETKNMQQNIAEKILFETKVVYKQLDEKEIFNAQSRLIAAINKNVGQEVWSNFIPNFKSLASINAIFNSKTAVKKRVLFEQATINRMSQPSDAAQESVLQPLDNLAYRSFIEKFNNKYTDLLHEQKELLNRYITGFADDGFELKVYLNEELSRLKGAVKEKNEATQESLISQKLVDVGNYLEEFRKREFTERDLNKILKTQQLVQELSTND
ncbi:MAG TPA: hypothetical protein EYN67_13485 [Flavobacteriales bacterium]|nr:hypothetical protein [Flavobacteriales bacterium]